MSYGARELTLHKLEANKMSTELFLIIWILAAVAWEVYSLLSKQKVYTISDVMSRLPRWTQVIIVLAWIILMIHWWF